MVRLLQISFILISFQLFSQSDFTVLDNASKRVPSSLKNHHEIAKHLTKNAVSDTEKARALYIWITHNIWYDVKLLNSIDKTTSFGSTEEIIENALKNKSGVCQHYSDLFLAMSKSIGLKSFLITGYTRTPSGDIPDFGHAWNAVKIDSKYYFIDATWASGHIYADKYIRKFNDAYFLVPPKEFIKNHIPFDPIWQFLENPIRHKDFTTRNFKGLDSKGNFSFKDSIEQLKILDKRTKLKKSNSRILRYGVTNDIIRDQIKYNLDNITSIDFNAVVDTLNYGIKNYNTYIEAKNRKFKNPKLSDSKISELIANAELGVNAANEMIFGLSSTKSKELNQSIRTETDRLPNLMNTIASEKEFVKKYLKKWKPLRGLLFYKFDSRTYKKTNKL